MRPIMVVLFSASVFLCMSQIIIFLSSLLSQNLNAICCSVHHFIPVVLQFLHDQTEC